MSGIYEKGESLGRQANISGNIFKVLRFSMVLVKNIIHFILKGSEVLYVTFYCHNNKDKPKKKMEGIFKE